MIGHLPGQSLVALARDGVDARRRIIGAKGKRPVLRNLEPAAIDRFRSTVEVLDLTAISEIEAIAAAVRHCAERNPGTAEPFAPNGIAAPIAGTVPEKMISDPAGYFVIFIDRPSGLLNVEHYKNNGVLTTIIEGRSLLNAHCSHGSTMRPISAASWHAPSTPYRSENPTSRTPHPSNVLPNAPATLIEDASQPKALSPR